MPAPSQAELELHLAAQSGDLDAAREALRAGASPLGERASSHDPSPPPLHFAVRHGDLAMAKLLLEAGALPNDSNFKTAYRSLGTAARAGDPAMVKLLLAFGADPNMETDGVGLGLVPAALAAREGHVEALEALLEAGASPLALDADGRAPLSSAMDFRTSTRVGRDGFEQEVAACVALLLRAAPSALDARENNGATPLMRAAASAFELGCEALLDAGADIEARDADGRSPLMWAARSLVPGVDLCCRLLLARGADPRPRDDEGRTAADIADESGNSFDADILRAAAAAMDARELAAEIPAAPGGRRLNL